MAIRRFAAIDVGSFELELGIYEIEKKIGIRRINHLRHVIALGKDTYNMGKISYELIEELCTILEDFAGVMREYGVEAYKAYATSALREAENRYIVLDRIYVRSGIEVKIISNSEQRLLSYMAAAGDEEAFGRVISEGAAIVDMGFGSMQITLYDNSVMINTQNFRLGVLRVREMIAKACPERERMVSNIAELADYELDVYNRLYLRGTKIKTIIGVGDPILYLVKKLGIDREGRADKKRFLEIYEIIAKMSREELEEKFGVSHHFAGIILPCIVIYKRIIERFCAEDIWIPGIRLIDGIAAEYAQKAKIIRKKHDFKEDIINNARNMAKRYEADGQDSACLEEYSLAIFDVMKKIHGLDARERMLLQIACILYHCGRFISMKNALTASYNIIADTEIVGISHDERILIANIAGYPAKVPDYKDVRAFKLIAILRLALALNRSYLQKIKDYRFRLDKNLLIISTSHAEDMTAEFLCFENNKDLFEEIYGMRAVLRQRRSI